MEEGDGQLELLRPFALPTLRPAALSSTGAKRICMTRLNLLTTRHGTENNLGEPSRRERSVADPTDNLEPPLDNSERTMVPVVDETSDVLLGHHGELFLEPRNHRTKPRSVSEVMGTVGGREGGRRKGRAHKHLRPVRRIMEAGSRSFSTTLNRMRSDRSSRTAGRSWREVWTSRRRGRRLEEVSFDTSVSFRPPSPPSSSSIERVYSPPSHLTARDHRCLHPWKLPLSSSLPPPSPSAG